MLRSLFVSLVTLAFVSHGQPASSSWPAGEILQALQSFAQTGRVLYVAAHPDDENTRLITYFSRGRDYRTGYLSLTRGDGGQNLIGPELRDGLGVIRTQELLAARRIDGGVQFFTRASDFGFSKTADETLSVWDRDQVLSDMVRVIRSFQPDVLVTRFSPRAGGTHGHHTASAQLALEAFRLAADPAAFADERGHLPPWQATRLLWNTSPGRAGVTADGLLPLDVGGYDPLRGESFGEIAARSRTMHKSQGFGAVGTRGPAVEHFVHLAGEPATADVMDGVDPTWVRVPGGARIGPLADDAIASFDPLQPAKSIPALLAIRRALGALSDNPFTHDKRAELDEIIAACLGLHVETTLAQAEVVPGEPFTLRHTVVVRSDVPVTWRGVRLPMTGARLTPDIPLEFNRPATVEDRVTLPGSTPLSHPYWLRSAGTSGMSVAPDAALIGRPENPPLLPVDFVFEVAGEQQIIVPTEPVEVIDDPVRGEVRRPLRAIPPISLHLARALELFAPGEGRPVHVELVAARPGLAGQARLEAPPGWQVTPSEQPFSFGSAGSRQTLTFNVTAPRTADTALLTASAWIDGQRFATGRHEIRYDHLPPQLLQPEARLKAVSLNLATRGQRVGYLPGAGDAVPESLTRMGYEVTLLSLDDLTRARLSTYDAVVLGVRAFNTRRGLEPRLPALFAFAEAGGTVIVQYNTTAELRTTTLAPYALRLSRNRVTEENAPVELLAPDHPALIAPNRITPADFDGWIQERGLYFPDQWAPQFTPLIASADTGEPPRTGGLLVARHGRGWFVYTGLSFFRQLPEGVPGAYRLFANLVSLEAADD